MPRTNDLHDNTRFTSLVNVVNAYLQTFDPDVTFLPEDWSLVGSQLEGELLTLTMHDDGCIANVIGRFNDDGKLISAVYCTSEADRFEVIL